MGIWGMVGSTKNWQKLTSHWCKKEKIVNKKCKVAKTVSAFSPELGKYDFFLFVYIM